MSAAAVLAASRGSVPGSRVRTSAHSATAAAAGWIIESLLYLARIIGNRPQPHPQILVITSSGSPPSVSLSLSNSNLEIHLYVNR